MLPVIVLADSGPCGSIAGKTNELLAKIEDLVAGKETTIEGYRAFLGMCHEKAIKLPAFGDTNLSEYVELYALALETGERYLPGTADEVLFLRNWYMEELLATRGDDDRLWFDRGRFREILSTFLYFLWMFGEMAPNNCFSWDQAAKKVQERMQMLRANGEKRGKLFDNPLHVWRQENSR